MQPKNTQSQSNPFAGILSALSGSTGLGAGSNPSGGTSQGMSAMGGSQAPSMGGPGAQANPMADQLTPGKNPGISKFLTQALQALQNALTESSDPNDLSVVRGLIQMLTKLIDQEQQKMSSGLSQLMGGQQPQSRGLGLTGSAPTGNAPTPSGASNANPQTGITSTYGQMGG